MCHRFFESVYMYQIPLSMYSKKVCTKIPVMLLRIKSSKFFLKPFFLSSKHGSIKLAEKTLNAMMTLLSRKTEQISLMWNEKDRI